MVVCLQLNELMNRQQKVISVEVFLVGDALPVYALCGDEASLWWQLMVYTGASRNFVSVLALLFRTHV
jgi:hypothetical protein